MSAHTLTAQLLRAQNCDVFIDFDGMVVPGDATDSLLARFADPAWREIEEEWQQGRLDSRTCLSRQVSLLRATPGDIARFLEELTIDPGFAGFIRLCRAARMRATILSDGMDLVVGTVLRRAGVNLPFFANRLVWEGGDRWRMEFPFARADCCWKMGNCKCSHRQLETAANIMVGDGRSDFCIAERCSFVLAKGRLADHCRERGLPHAEIADFAEARRILAMWLRRRRGQAAPRSAAGPAIAQPWRGRLARALTHDRS